MAMAEATRQSNALPSISYLDLENIKRETSIYHSKVPSSAALNMAAPPLVSPSSLYSGPPPPYSYPSSTASSVVGGHNGYLSPSDSRKVADDDKEPQPSSRHSLPSISEALLNRGEAPLSITSLLSKTGPPQPVQSQPISSRSPTSPSSRTYSDPTPRAPPTSLPHSHSSPVYSEAPPRSPYSPRLTVDSGNPRSAGASMYDNRYSSMQPPKTAPSPANISRPAMPAPQFRHASPIYDNVPRSAPAVNPPHTYSAYPTPYSYGPPMQSIPSYPPSSSPSYHPSWRYADPDHDRPEDPRRAPAKESPVKPAFGEAIKRHLEVFDLETSLNEIAEGSGRALDFSNLYGTRSHQTARSGPVTGSTPSLAECDEMITRQNRVLEAMFQIKGIIVAQQQAMAEQRNYDQNFKPSNEVDDDGASFHDKLEGSGGFAGAEAKKRRGRAAPPGRCHSCNRAETPEWRRGPDGARTLCNACGLHYAKLTRKMGSKPASAGSSLRPKESSP